MDVLMLSHSDTGSGAAIAARRLNEGLNGLGVNAKLRVRRRGGTVQEAVAAWEWRNRMSDRVRVALDKLPLIPYRHYDGTPFSIQWLPDGLSSRVDRLEAALINVHWIGHGYVQPATLAALRRPIVWTLHDVWPFTGGCHVNLDCQRFEEQCGACPRLGSSRPDDLSRSIWREKQRAWSHTDLTLVAPSTWMARCARSSPLFRDIRIEVIPNGLNMEVFTPVPKPDARSRLGLPLDRKLVLFSVAANRRVPHKGIDLLEAAVERLAADGHACDNIDLVLVGPPETAGSIRTALRKHVVGTIHTDSAMAALLAAVDTTVVPSRQENLSQVGIESLACGTPVVAFDTTGLPDVIQHQKTGFLARPFDPEALAHGIRWVLGDPDRHHRLSTSARMSAMRMFDIDDVAARYVALFDELMRERRSKLT